MAAGSGTDGIENLRPAKSADAAEKDLILPPHRLNPAGSVHPHWRMGPPSRNCRHCRGARPGTGRLRFSHAAFEKSDFDVMLIFNHDKLDVDSMLEIMMAPDLGRFRLPPGSELPHKHHVVRDCPLKRECRAPLRTPA